MKPIELLNGAFSYTQDENGKWIYKSNIDQIGKNNKEKIKVKSKEKPQFPIIDVYEKAASDSYRTLLHHQTLQIVSYLQTLINRNNER